MIRKIYINNGINELLYPFKNWIKDVKYIKASRLLVGHGQYELDLLLLDGNKSKIVITDNKEINELCKLWKEGCFSDFLHNIIAPIILDNTDLNSETIEVYL